MTAAGRNHRQPPIRPLRPKSFRVASAPDSRQLAGVASQFWLVKQEPAAYSWSDFLRDRQAAWTGVRNFQARNHLRAMKKGDLVLFYHTGDEKQCVGLARVEKESYPDPTGTEGDWSTVDLSPVKKLKQPVSLERIKADKSL